MKSTFAVEICLFVFFHFRFHYTISRLTLNVQSCVSTHSRDSQVRIWCMKEIPIEPHMNTNIQFFTIRSRRNSNTVWNADKEYKHTSKQNCQRLIIIKFGFGYSLQNSDTRVFFLKNWFFFSINEGPSFLWNYSIETFLFLSKTMCEENWKCKFQPINIVCLLLGCCSCCCCLETHILGDIATTRHSYFTHLHSHSI